ncbi:MAG: mandelate racemase/muconate lactonizing enzyme family protein [Planctomycetota bacterium]|nr:mandelate racemase/muconate lactonizing enzyme family protein [Planctomycetota bacterium]
MIDRHRESESPVGRRELLASMGLGTAAILGFGMTQEVEGARAQVADKGSTLRITSVRAFSVVGKLYVRIDTNHGITGWGEAIGLNPKVALALVEVMADGLEGENPTRIEHIWQRLYRGHRDTRGGPYMTNVISAIDTALWDIAGKAWGVPVYRLLGGPTRDRIRMYPSATSYKVGPGGPKEFAGTPRDVKGYVDHVAEIRKRLGPDGAIMLDAHCALPPPFLIQLAGALQPYEILFIEEPAVPGNIEVFKRLKQAIRIPLATGERDRTIWGVISYLHEGCIDILQPDVGACGGITQMKKIAVLAEAYHVPLAPHCASTILGLTASLHVAAAIPMFLIHEGGTGYNPSKVARVAWKVDEKGDASLPEGPGLGVEVDESVVRKLHEERPRKYRWPTPRLRDGSIADY